MTTLHVGRDPHPPKIAKSVSRTIAERKLFKHKMRWTWNISQEIPKQREW